MYVDATFNQLLQQTCRCSFILLMLSVLIFTVCRRRQQLLSLVIDFYPHPLMLFFSVLYMSCLIIMYMSIPHISFLYSFSYFLSLLQPLYFYHTIYRCIFCIYSDKCQDKSLIHQLLMNKYRYSKDIIFFDN